MRKIIEIKNLKKDYGSNNVLKNVNLDVYEGEVVTIIGSSGSGKSTLLRCINLLEEPNDGIINIFGNNILESNTNLELLRTEVGMVFQNFNLFDNKNVLNNCILAPMKVLNLSYEEAKQRALANLEKVNMLEFKNQSVKTLSGGQKQRVAIARALCMEPKIMLFDEPTSALDPEMIKEVLLVMKDLVKDNISMVIVTHEMEFAKKFSDTIIVLDKGEIVEVDSPDVIFNNPKTKRTKMFIDSISLDF